MKLVIAIINNDDSTKAASALTKSGFFVTKLATSGGFLKVGNTTFMIGIQDDEVPKVVEILKTYCTTRKQYVVSTPSLGVGIDHASIPEEIKVGGATIFVLNMDHMEKI